MQIYDFRDALALDDAPTKNVLLGNGFSIALRPDIFTYRSLYETAEFRGLPAAKRLFEAAQTHDFEAVIKLLIFAKQAAVIFRQDEKFVERIDRYIEGLRDVLVDTLGKNHPDRPYNVSSSKYRSVREFLNNFSKIYTLNYDLLLYWAMHQEGLDKFKFPKSDGFSNPDDGMHDGFCQWLPGNSSAQMYFLHGALHLVDSSSGILKYTFSKTARPIMEQMRESLSMEKYPLFVSEGDSQAKFEKIMHNGYLSRAYESFSNSCRKNKRGSIWIFGHSLDSNDDHIFKCIRDGAVPRLWVSLKDSDPNKQAVIDRAMLIASARPESARLNVRFFDADSARVWTAYDD